ncbi:A/G-specific adenine glycosylase [Niameybacter massiliensis]|uniref:Adenine DNA glycosylase n=1 Tax=Holtiella tumoricola TaxID=3018743 RepID=A0AA42DMR6_9FIRM|nr:A/G-specific adenine glycosylase [Holtiella tumoricola]
MSYQQYLLEWFDKNKRQMPWRERRDAYSIWVSEVMLQQTQVDTVRPYYERFMERFPTVKDLASADKEEVYTYWQGLGYYRRADNLHKGAKVVAEQYDGVFPMEARLVKDIPGIGPYTMGAVLSIAFNLPYPAVDGNVMRVLSRQFLIDDDIAVAKTRKIFEAKVMSLMPEDARNFNQALMELGALICTPKNPKCNICPMQTLCMAYHEGAQTEYPVKSSKTKAEPEFYKALVIKKEDSIYLEKRKDEGLLASLWGVPLITLEQWEVVQKMGIEFEVLDQVKHVFTHRVWMMSPIVIEYNEKVQEIINRILQNTGEFVPEGQIKEYPVATAFTKILRKL